MKTFFKLTVPPYIKKRLSHRGKGVFLFRMCWVLPQIIQTGEMRRRGTKSL